ncbi:hypothetical protein [Archangium sp.]|uniref:SitA5 family polymorphic toxin n=1 Tax=Archangium sp. TaxID=1872627 RepID=UPI00389A063A
MSPRRVGPRPPGAPLRHLLAYWFVLFVFFQSACATHAPWGSLTPGYRYTSLTPPPAPRARVPPSTEPGLEKATVYIAAFFEPGAVATRPVPILKPEFQRALQRLARDVRLGQRTPREAALELLRLSGQPARDVETVASAGEWNLEMYRGQGYTLVPEKQQGPVALTPEANETLKQQYLQWCAPQGGGDCLRLLDDGPYLKADDRYTFALALAFGRVLDETREALKAELLSVQALVSMVVWTVALYCMMWVVPEPTTKLVAASLTVILMGYLGLSTVYGLIDGWARLVIAAGEATTFDELRAAGEQFGKVLGEDAARAMILAVSTLAGHTLGQVLPRLKSLPGFTLAAEQFEAQGGAAVMTHAEAVEATLETESALARAVAATEEVATSPQGPLAVVMLKKGHGPGRETARGGRSAQTVIRHRGGNRQVQLSDGQRWHLPPGKSVADIPAEDKVGDMLQEVVTKAAKKWGPDRRSDAEKEAIKNATDRGEYWLSRLLEREARGRFVHAEVKAQLRGSLQFKHQGVDVVDLTTGRKYEILSGTESNLARHGRRMASEFFRMLTF